MFDLALAKFMKIIEEQKIIATERHRVQVEILEELIKIRKILQTIKQEP